MQHLSKRCILVFITGSRMSSWNSFRWAWARFGKFLHNCCQRTVCPCTLCWLGCWWGYRWFRQSSFGGWRRAVHIRVRISVCFTYNTFWIPPPGRFWRVFLSSDFDFFVVTWCRIESCFFPTGWMISDSSPLFITI